MAYAALVSLAQTIDLFLKPDKYCIPVDQRENLKSVREYVNYLQSFLEGPPEKANVRLEGKIRDVANQAEVIIEDFMWRKIGETWLPREFEDQLNEVREQLGSIAGETMDPRSPDLPAAISSLRLAPTGKNDMVIGLDDNLMAINKRLCGEPSQLQVIPIVGMGGIGKTTLARSAYDHPLSIHRFEIRAWITVSQDYSTQEILSGLLDSMKLGNEQVYGELVNKVRQNLTKRRYFIVMDDVWNTEAWDELMHIFPDDNNGSRIILTTRLEKVAAYPPSRSPLEMKCLDENQSWNLLKQKVFTINTQDCPPELEDIGKEIARSCRGLPLAVVLVAGILSNVNKTRASWEKTAENVNLVFEWELDKIILLSYTHLPHHLRPCFLYMGVFPEDYQIHVPRLINLWVAEGFLKHQNEKKKSLEEEAEEYLEDLVMRNLVLVTKRNINGKIKRCSLHDLVRILCIRKAYEEKFFRPAMNRSVGPESMGKERRIIMSRFHLDYRKTRSHLDYRKTRSHLDYPGPTISTIMSRSHLDYIRPTFHTIMRFPLDNPSSSEALLECSRLLRVLDVVNHPCDPLPSQLYKLYHRRYLALQSILEIPEAISNLVNLQTLIIKGYVYETSLPSGIWRMPQLRHIITCTTCKLPDPDPWLTLPLANLQTLLNVQPVCCEKTVKMIPNLKKLGLHCCTEEDHQLQNLIHLTKLEELKITGYFDLRRENIAFPQTLKKLKLRCRGLPWDVMDIVASLPYLEVLKLVALACDGDTWTTADGEFPRLKFLQMDFRYLKHWITEGSPFPRLERLLLGKCPYLNEIPDSIGEIPTLELIEVGKENHSLVNSAHQIKEERESSGYDDLEVRCI